MMNSEPDGARAALAPDFEIGHGQAAHGRAVQKESFAARPRASHAARGVGLLVLGALAASCVTGQVADSSTDETVTPAAGTIATSHGGSLGVGGTGGAVTHPSGGGGASSSGGHAGSGAVGGGGATSKGGTGGGGTANTGGVPTTGGTAGSVATGGAAGMPATDCSMKRGVAYGFDVTSAAQDMNALKAGVSWFYGWSNGPSGNAKGVYATEGMEFVPMVWGGGFNVDNVVKQIPADAKYLLGFNEPNFGASKGQSNLTPQQAAALWPQIEAIATQKNLKIVSPALNYCSGDCNQTDPFVWLDQFFAACPNCKVDYLGAHWYACTVNALQDYVTKLKKYNRPIWLTEFACADGGPYTPDQVKTYALQATNYLEHEPTIFRYSWFSGRTDGIQNVNLLAGSGQLTDLGTAYVNQTPKRCQ